MCNAECSSKFCSKSKACESSRGCELACLACQCTIVAKHFIRPVFGVFLGAHSVNMITKAHVMHTGHKLMPTPVVVNLL